MDTRRLIFGSLFVVLLLILVLVFRSEPRYKRGASNHQVAIDSFFLAIIFVMGLVPQFGYITLVPGFSLTLLHIPVLLGAYLYGPKRGLLYGLFFGLTSLLASMLQPAGFNAFFVYPWVSVLPRILFGFLAGSLFYLLRKNTKIYRNGLVVGGASFLLTCLHSTLVFLDLYVFFPSETKAFLFASGSFGASLSGLVIGFVALGMLGEVVLAAILVTALGKATLRFVKR